MSTLSLTYLAGGLSIVSVCMSAALAVWTINQRKRVRLEISFLTTILDTLVDLVFDETPSEKKIEAAHQDLERLQKKTNPLT